MSECTDQPYSQQIEACVVRAPTPADGEGSSGGQGPATAKFEAWMSDPYDTEMNVYAVIDAGTVVGLPEVLAHSGLDHCCLYDDPDTFDAAPWLVRLLRGHSLQPWSLKARDAPGPFGLCDPGFILLSPAPLGHMRKHLRKFTRQKIEGQDRWIFVRFWEPDVAQFYFDAVSHDPEKAALWFDTAIDQIVAVCDGVAKSWRRASADKAVSRPAPVHLSAAEMSSLRLYRKTRFQRDMIKLFQQKSPDQADTMGEKRLADIVTIGTDRAQSHGFTRTSSVQLYIHMCLALGTGFATDPQLHWVRPILKDTSTDAWAQQQRADELRAGLLVFLERVNGRKGEHMARFAAALEDALPSLAADVTAQDTKAFLVAHFRTRTQEIGDETLDWLVQDTVSGCSKLGLEQGRSAFVLTMLRFVFGTECVHDPRFDWLHRCLFEPPKTGTRDKALQSASAKFVSDTMALKEKAR